VRRRLPIGAELVEDGVDFRVWAPSWREVSLVIEAPARGEIALRAEELGYFSVLVPRLATGARYRFRLGGELFADPASRYQPDGPFGASAVVDPRAFAWTDDRWRGIVDPERQVLYELHVGTFTREGTWDAAAERLPFLADLGITTIEMMPVNDFAGRRGWGYDGVNLFAPTRNYGTPDELRAFVDRAHGLGVAVILDVVYNHFGPAGNSLYRFGPYRRTGERGAWGDALDYAQPAVREFFAANAAYWIDELHFDGLRLDAVQIIDDQSLVGEVVRRARAAAGTRRIFVVAEDEPQDTAVITEQGVDALWNDDFEHTARVALTGVSEGYFHDFTGTPQELISAIRRGFLYQGQLYAWQRNARGTPTRGLAPSRFVHCLENHDQVANLGLGERLVELADPAMLRALTALLLLGPEVPMLFQGQETGSRRPWNYFIDHDPELSAIVERGRARFLTQFARMATPEAQAAISHPAALATFEACILDEPRPSPWLALHKDLIALRGRGFADRAPDGAVLGDRTLCLRWWEPDYLLLLNLGPTFRRAILPEPLLAPPRASGWCIAWSSEEPAYGGHGTPEPFTRARLAIPAHAAVLCASDPSRCLRIEPSPPSGEDDPLDP
jgi:maltooligosyltrehalose trehalohydrolase